MIDKAKAFFWKHKLPVLLVLLVISIVLPFVIKQALILRYICTIMMYATLAGSLNVINGYSGQTCLGQAGFFAIGAYTCAALSKNVGVDFWIALPIAGILASLVGLIVSLPTLKLSGIYLSIVTLGASEIIRIIAQTWTGHQTDSLSKLLWPGNVQAQILLFHFPYHRRGVPVHYGQGITVQGRPFLAGNP